MSQHTPTDARRRARFALHHWSQANSVRDGARICMRAGEVSSVVSVGVTDDGVTHVSGIKRCASWACPVCAPAMGETRSREIDLGLSEALARGWYCYLVTATVSHKLGDYLSDVRNLVHDSWRAAFAGGSSTRWKARSGYVGQIKSSEATYGVNGWHPHIHAVLIFTKPQPGLAALGARFARMVGKRGGFCASAGRGWDWAPITTASAISGYLCKVEGGWGAGLELARTDLKSARRGGLQPFELLARAAAGDGPAAVLWRIYERATFGRRKLVWSRGLKVMLGVTEVTDDEAAEGVKPHDFVAVVDVPAAVWNRAVVTGVLAEVLERCRVLAIRSLVPV